MNRARTLVTGVNGFTGQHLAPLLAALGDEVHGIVHKDAGEIEVSGLAAIHGVDLADATAVAKTVAAVGAHRVVHLAAIAFVAHGDVDLMYRTNILGARHLLDALARAEHRPDAVLLASSANVYGNTRGGVLDETMPASPANDYGVTKLAMEYVASLYRARLPIIVARPFNYTGRGQSEAFLIPKIVAHVRRRASVIELGNLDVARDFSDVRTVVDAYARLLSTPSAIGGTFNICSGRALALQEILEIARDISGHDLSVRVDPALVRADEVRSLCGTAASLESVIGPLEARPFSETLRWMLGA